jgi:anti-sigma-K factor RskA
VNVKEYISSGIIESYVLGMTSEEERQEFEQACTQYPEIVKARESFELSLEQVLLQESIQPPTSLKGQIESLLFQDPEPETMIQVADEREGLIRKIGLWRWAAAASIILLAGAVFWGITSNQKFQQVAKEKTELQQQLDQSVAQLNELKGDASMLQKPGVKMAALQGTNVSPASFATVYWDTTSRDVYLMINNLPKPAADQQYQLWALMDNQPIDLGVFEMKQEKLLVKMKNVQKAQAFAITLEPKGGSANPSLNNMFVAGKL